MVVIDFRCFNNLYHNKSQDLTILQSKWTTWNFPAITYKLGQNCCYKENKIIEVANTPHLETINFIAKYPYILFPLIPQSSLLLFTGEQIGRCIAH